jgi:hypothetical protein
MSKIKIIDNYLSDKNHQSILNLASSPKMNWSFGTILPFEKSETNSYSWPKETALKYNYRMYHVLFHKVMPSGFYQQIAGPVMDILRPNAIVKVKLNLSTCTEKIIRHGFHVDNNYKNCKTAIYYLNDNDGYTMFENGEKIESVANRLVTFPTSMKHCGTTCTNTHARLVLNINYFKN